MLEGRIEGLAPRQSGNLAVELPLYFTDQTSALATAKLLLGVPLYAIVLWITWLLVRSVWSFGMSPSDSSEETR